MTTDTSWSTIYPAYINSNRTEAQGRRLGKSKCLPDPRWQEIKDILEAHNDFKVQAEGNKVYPRELDKELPTSRGRIKYQTTNPAFAKKRDVLVYLTEMLPQLKARAKGAVGTTAPEPQPSQSGGGSKNKKKGRK